MPLIDFVNPIALMLLWIIVPVIILYLLKPKPKHVKIPSIMFILRIEKTKRFSSWFKRFIRDPLLLVQILILLLLIFSIADPFILGFSAKNPKENVVLILDASASMQSTDISPNRFEKAKDMAISILENLNPESRVSVIFAENVPILVLRDSDVEKAKNVIGKLYASDAASNVQDAIIFANDLLSVSKQRKKIYVLSDFSNVGDVKLAKGISLSKGIEVEFVKIFGNGKNVGITSMNSKRFLAKRGEFYLTFSVKNFNDAEEEIIGEIFLDNELLARMNKVIPPNSEELFYMNGECSTEEHELKIELKNQDSLEMDNIAFWILPEIKQYKILLITNKDTYLKHALESNLDFSLDIANPPVIPNLEIYDTVILGNIDKDLILPGMFLDLRKYVENSGNLVIIASESLSEIKNENLEAILPVNLEETISASGGVSVERKHETLEDVILENVILKK